MAEDYIEKDYTEQKCENGVAEGIRKDIEAAMAKIITSITTPRSIANKETNPLVQEVQTIALMLSIVELIGNESASALVPPEKFNKITSQIKEVLTSKYASIPEQNSLLVTQTLNNITNIIEGFEIQTGTKEAYSNNETGIPGKVKEAREKIYKKMENFSPVDLDILKNMASNYYELVGSIVVDGIDHNRDRLCDIFKNKVVNATNFSKENQTSLEKKLDNIQQLWDPIKSENYQRNIEVFNLTSIRLKNEDGVPKTVEKLFADILKTGFDYSSPEERAAFIKDQLINPRENQAEILGIVNNLYPTVIETVVDGLKPLELVEVCQNMTANLDKNLEKHLQNKMKGLHTTDLVAAYNESLKNSDSKKTAPVIETLKENLTQRVKDYQDRSVFKQIIMEIASIFSKAVYKDEHAFKWYVKNEAQKEKPEPIKTTQVETDVRPRSNAISNAIDKNSQKNNTDWSKKISEEPKVSTILGK